MARELSCTAGQYVPFTANWMHVHSKPVYKHTHTHREEADCWLSPFLFLILWYVCHLSGQYHTVLCFSHGKERLSGSRLGEFLMIATWIWLRLPFACRSFLLHSKYPHLHAWRGVFQVRFHVQQVNMYLSTVHWMYAHLTPGYTHQKKVMPPLLLFLMLMFIATSVNLLVAFLYPVFSHRGKGFWLEVDQLHAWCGSFQGDFHAQQVN
jgi:hypothetical protein